jgi:hypothetical protein
MKLTFAISAIAVLLVGGTATICMSPALNDKALDYNGVRTTRMAIEHWLNPLRKSDL